MIKTEVEKTVIMEKEVIEKLHKYTKSKNMENFIKTFIDWMLDNDIRIDVFSLTNPEYVEDNKDKPIQLEGCSTCYNYYNYCRDLTGLDEEDFCYLIHEVSKSEKLFRYKELIIDPRYNIGTNRSYDDYYYSPHFIIYYPEEVKEIK